MASMHRGTLNSALSGTRRVGLLLTLLGLVALAAACSSSGDDDARSVDGPEPGDDVEVADLEPGLCFDTDEIGTVEEVEIELCRRAGYEVVDVFEVDEDDDEDYPGFAFFVEEADDECRDDFDTIFAPSEETWDDGDRTVVCVLGGDAAMQFPTPTPGGEELPTPAEGDDRDGDGIPDDIDECPDEPESPVAGEESNWDDDTDGCPDDIEDLVDLGRLTVEAFWIEQFAAAEIEYIPPREFVAYSEPIDTECGPADLNNAFYCPPSHGIYYDITFFEILLETEGDFAPVFVVAHEWGHLVQALLGRLNGQFLSIHIELQADCLAGAYTFYAEEQGILEEGDFEEAVQTLLIVGDPLDSDFFDPSAHGTDGQRLDAFQRGVEQGVASCLETDFTPRR
jgi:hypothetical protein